MPYELIEVTREGKVGTLTLNRPAKRNALSVAMRDEISMAIGELGCDTTLRVIMVLSRGEVFCAGFDKSEFTDTSPESIERMSVSSDRYHAALAECPLPLVAGIQGPAPGGGFDLAVLCDVRIATPAATFSHPEIKFGAPALFRPLRGIIGGGPARDLVLTGRSIDADEALRLGLVSRVVPAASLADECRKTALQIAEAPRATLVGIKGQIRTSYGGWNGLTLGGAGLFDAMKR